MDRDIEIELVETIQEKDRRIKELEAMNETIGRELLARTDELNEVLEKQAKEIEELNKQYDKLTQYFIKNHVAKDKIRELANYFENGEQEIKFDWVMSKYPIKVADSKWVAKILRKKLLEEE